MTNLYEFQEEQLLQGVVMTTSISCPSQQLCPENTVDGREETYSFTLNNDSFSITSNQTIGLEMRDQAATQHFEHYGEQRIGELRQTTKPKTVNRADKRLSQLAKKTNTKKTWETLLELDNKLFEIHYTGILQKAEDVVSKMNQIVLTEEYCKLKTYERQLFSIIRQVQFSLNQYEKQKKSLVNQISLLKADNDNLNKTIGELYTTIEELELACEDHFKTPLSNYLLTSSNSKKDSPKSKFQDIQIVPFARSFYHSLEEMNLMKIIQQEQRKSIPVSTVAEFVFDLKKEIESLLNGNKLELPFNQTKFRHLFSTNSTMAIWTSEIFENLERIRKKDKHQQTNILEEQSKSKIVEAFLRNLSQFRQEFIKDIQGHSNKELQFWHIIHSCVVSFLGILVNETKWFYLQVSFGDNINMWMKVFLNEMNIIREDSKVELKEQNLRYWGRIEQFLHDINELAVFRMLRNYD